MYFLVNQEGSIHFPVFLSTQSNSLVNLIDFIHTIITGPKQFITQNCSHSQIILHSATH